MQQWYWWYSLVLISVEFLSNVLTDETPLPDYIHVCHKSDPELDNCIVKSIEILRPYLAKGIPEIDVPGLEPLHIGKLNLLEESMNGISLTTEDINAYEAGNFQINKLRVIDLGKAFDFQLFFRRLRIEGLYNVNGQFLTFPIKGNGKFDVYIVNVTADAQLIMEIKEENGKNMYEVKDIKIHSKIGKGKVKLYNLFGGDRVLGDVINTAINQNFATLSNDLIPIIEMALSEKLKDIAKKIVGQFTYDQLLPE